MIRPHFIAGVLTPELLERLTANIPSPALAELKLCNVIEIRYDLFPQHAEWPALAARVLQVHPHAQIIGTIRLQRDGGKIPDQDFALRFADWERICMAPQHPHWIDVEQILIDQLTREIDLAHAQGIRVLVSQHNFQRVPSLPRLRAQAQQARAAGAQGFKIAAMSKHVGDTTRLYSFARKECRHFEWLAAFAMGATGQASRVRSLRCGANLTYAALGKAVAPGQLTAMEMRQKIAHLKP